MNMQDIVAKVSHKIRDGSHPRGTRLESTRKMAKRYGVTHQTVANAYGRLAALGLVDVRPNGTYVIASPQASAHLGTYGALDITAAKPWQSTGKREDTNDTHLVRQLQTTDHMANWGITTGVVERHKIRSSDGIPTQYKITIIPYHHATKMPEGHEGIPPMLAPVGAAEPKPPHGVRMADWLGWNVDHIDTLITVEPMESEAATALELPAGTPGFRIAAVAKADDESTTFITLTIAPLHHQLTLTTK